MRGDVIVNFSAGSELSLAAQAMGDAQAARAWLDEQYLAFDCEPIRASGKVLTADKLLCIVEAAGASAFADPAWSAGFASAALASTGRPLVRIDVPARSVSF